MFPHLLPEPETKPASLCTPESLDASEMKYRYVFFVFPIGAISAVDFEAIVIPGHLIFRGVFTRSLGKDFSGSVSFTCSIGKFPWGNTTIIPPPSFKVETVTRFNRLARKV